MKTLHFFSPLLAGLLVLVSALPSLAASGPQHRTLRGLSMGNAFVAVVDDKDALYYNPAGLNLINALGNAKARPGLAAYPRNRFNARVNVIGTAVPVGDALDFWDFYSNHKKAFKEGGQEDILADSTLFGDLLPFHKRPIDMAVFHGAEFAMHNFGFAYWTDVSVSPYVNVGILFPQEVGVETIQMDAAIQAAGARGLMNNRLAVGAGYRIVNRQTVKDFRVSPAEIQEDGPGGIQDRVLDTLSAKLSDLDDISTYGQGVDLGILWQQTTWLRFGGAVQSLGMYLNHELVTPEVTIGAAVTPPLLSSGGILARKVNLAVDIEDVFNDDQNYKLLSKVNFGAEVEQNLWRFASVRVGSGFKGGYWTAGFGVSAFNLVHIEGASWAEETGYYTGQSEDRFYAVRVGVGL